MLEILYKPNSNVNYNFISNVYLLFTTLGIFLYILEVFLKFEIAKGIWIVFIPFVPTLIWSIIIKSSINSSQDFKNKDQ